MDSFLSDYDGKVQRYYDGLGVEGRTVVLNLWGMNKTSPTTKYKMLATSEKKKINDKYYEEIAQ